MPATFCDTHYNQKQYMNNRLSLTTQAHEIIQANLTAGDIAIDATAGNGHDTLFLAKQVGAKGKVFAFDIQQQAINETHSRLSAEGSIDNTKLFQCSHSEMDAYIPSQYHSQIKAIIFNLGYLPGSDKTITTQTDSTLLALKKSVQLLAATGLISIIAYPGHPSGAVENNHLMQWCKQLNPEQFHIKIINSSDKITAPRLFIITKSAY